MFYGFEIKPLTPSITTSDLLVYNFSGSSYNRFTGDGTTGSYTEFSIGCWFRPSTIALGETLIVRSNGNPISAWSHAIRQQTNTLEGYVYDGGINSIITDAFISIGTWYHIVLTCKNNELMRLYINGILQVSASIGTSWTGGNDWWIARGSGGGPSNNATGELADVSIWNEQLSLFDIVNIYSGSRGASYITHPQNLLLYCPMNDTDDMTSVSSDWIQTQPHITQSRTGTPTGKLLDTFPNLIGSSSPSYGFQIGSGQNYGFEVGIPKE